MEASFVITGEFLQRAYLKRWLGHCWLLVVAVGLMVPALAGDLRSGEFGAVSIVGLSALGFFVLRFGFAWLRLRRSIADWTRRQGDAPVRYRFEPDTVTAESFSGATTLKWACFKKLIIHPHHTLLEFPHRAGSLTLPTDQISKELLDYLVGRFHAHGLPVKGGRKD